MDGTLFYNINWILQKSAVLVGQVYFPLCSGCSQILVNINCTDSL